MKDSIILLALLTAGIILFSGCNSTTTTTGNDTKAVHNASTTTTFSTLETGPSTSLLQDTTTIQPSETTTTKASSGTTTTRGGPKTIEVDIKSFAFDPKTIAITKGDTVVWTNMDAAPHRVISDIGSVKTELDSQTLAKGDTYSHTFSELGTYAYHCSIHTSMKGEIIVD
jgi:plastocyanin